MSRSRHMLSASGSASSLRSSSSTSSLCRSGTSPQLSSDGSVVSVGTLTSREVYYYKSVKKAFEGRLSGRVDEMADIVEGKSAVSLRVLDWFVTKYSNRYGVGYKLASTDGDEFVVYISYKAQLRSYRKKYFDPFRRRDKFHLRLGNREMLTTIGQLNFFRWAFSNQVVRYVGENMGKISRAMNGLSGPKRASERRRQPPAAPDEELVDGDGDITLSLT